MNQFLRQLAIGPLHTALVPRPLRLCAAKFRRRLLLIQVVSLPIRLQRLSLFSAHEGQLYAHSDSLSSGQKHRKFIDLSQEWEWLHPTRLLPTVTA